MLLLTKAPPLLIPVPLRVSALVFVRVWPYRSNTAPALTVMALLEAPKAVALPAWSVPPPTVVPPT